MAYVHVIDYFPAPSVYVSVLREVDRYDRFSVRDVVRDVAEWKTQRDMVARLLDRRQRHLEPAFFDEPPLGPGRSVARPAQCARSYPPPKHSYYQGDF